jgi:hypothetical protein
VLRTAITALEELVAGNTRLHTGLFDFGFSQGYIIPLKVQPIQHNTTTHLTYNTFFLRTHQSGNKSMGRSAVRADLERRWKKGRQKRKALEGLRGRKGAARAGLKSYSCYTVGSSLRVTVQALVSSLGAQGGCTGDRRIRNPVGW